MLVGEEHKKQKDLKLDVVREENKKTKQLSNPSKIILLSNHS